ncbi:hypothetical protein ASF08_10575 [Methylobacterium sp. Leaf85]|nr:hypothetical protein ASF08_10575 [Methylobacterium sp. Leaf85]
MAFAKTSDQLARMRAAVNVVHREANGRHKRSSTKADLESRRKESEDQIMAVALAQPHRRSLPKTRIRDDGRRQDVDPRDPLAGFALGRLFLHGVISRDQLEAGQKYTSLFLRHGHHVVGVLPRFPSAAINDVASGISCAAEMSYEEAVALKRSWNEAQTALADTFEWRACASALMHVCVLDREPGDAAMLGSLRVALNALGNLWSDRRSRR